MTPHDRDRRRRTIAALLEARDALRAERAELGKKGRLHEMIDEYATVTVALSHVEVVLERLAAREEVSSVDQG